MRIRGSQTEKESRTRPFLLLLAIFLLAPLTFALDFEVNFTKEDLKFREFKGFLKAYLEGSISYHLPGAPDIPVLSYTLALPEGQEVKAVRVVDLRWVPVRKGVLSPVQRPPSTGKQAWEPPNRELYREVFPRSPLLGYREGGLYGRRVLGIILSPVRFDPKDTTIYFLERILLKIETRPESREPLRPKRTWPAAERARIEAFERSVVGGKVSPFLELSLSPGAFNPTFPPSLEGSPVAYVIITTEEMKSSFEPIAEWHTKTGLPSVVRTVSWIEDNYEGSDRAEKIRNFLKDAYELWGTQWVLLGGDHEEIPLRFVFVDLPAAGEYRSEPTDRYYACLEGSWNADGDDTFGELSDSVDLYPEIFVARLPARYPEEADIMVGKVLQYLENPGAGEGAYLEKALFMGSSMFTEGDGASLCEEVSEHFPDEFFKGRIYETESYSPTTQEFIDSLSGGYGMVFTESHASFSFLLVSYTPSRSFRVGHTYLLTNLTKPSFIHMVNCNAGGIDKECLAENFLRAPGGAFAVLSTTRLNYPYIDVDMTKTLYDTLFLGGVHALTPWLYQGQMPYLPYAQIYDNYSRYIILGYNLLGDPALEIRTKAPHPLQVASPAGISLGSQTFTVTVTDSITGLALSGARVTVTKPAEIYTSALTNPAGEATFIIEPETPGSLTVWVTDWEYLPKSKEIPVYGLGGWLSLARYEIDDTQYGDADGVPEAAETLLVHLWVQNLGDEVTSFRRVKLLTSYPGFSISPEEIELGHLSPGDTVSLAQAFEVVASPRLADRDEVVFVVFFNPSLRGDTVVLTNLEDPKKKLVDYDTLRVVFRSPELVKIRQRFSSSSDTGFIRVALFNYGGGDALDVLGKLESPQISFFGSSVAFGDFPPDFYLDDTLAPAFSFELPEGSIDSIPWSLILKDHRQRAESLNFYLASPEPPESLWSMPRPLGFRLDWQPVLEYGVLGYRVYEAADPSGPFESINLLPLLNPFYVGSGLPWGEEVYLKVSTVDIYSNESPLSESLKVYPNPPELDGWPRNLVDLGPAAVLVLELDDATPGLEVVIPNKVGEIYAFSSTGQLLDGWPISLRDKDEFWGGAAAGDLDGDGEFELVLVPWSDTNSVFAFEKDGTKVQGWPVSFEGGGSQGYRGAFGPPAVLDLDGDGKDEVVINSLRGTIHIWHGDGTGFLDSTGHFYDLPDVAWAYSSPALGDIDQDGEIEIVVGSNLSRVFAFELDATPLEGFPITVSGGIYTAPVVADFDSATPGLEIAVGTYGNRVYIIDHGANVLPGWPQLVPFSCDVCVGLSAANLDEDPEPELIVHYNSGLYAFDKDGSPVPGFPVSSGGGRSSAVVGDVDQDTEPEIFWNTQDGWLRGVDKSGQELYGFPIFLGEDGPSSPLLTDLNGDGMIDLIGSAGAGLLYGYTLMSNFGQLEWPFYKHDIGRTGCYSTPSKMSLSATSGEGERVWMLWKPTPSIADRNSRLFLLVPINSEGKLEIFNSAGRKVRTLYHGSIAPGRYTFEWRGEDDSAKRVPSGVYFARASFAGFLKVEKLIWLRR